MGERRLCPFCGAATWKCEGSTCCNGGEHVARRVPEPPRGLLHWKKSEHLNPWTGKLPRKDMPWCDRHEAVEQGGFAGLYTEPNFSEASRRLNNYFSFSGIGADTGRMGVERVARPVPPGSFVRLAGRVYHYIPSTDDERSTVPYYVNDTSPSTVQKTDDKWVKTIHRQLRKTHPLAQKLRAARKVKAREVRIVPDPSRPSPECTTEIAARYRISTTIDEKPHRNFVVFAREGGQQWYPSLNHEEYETLQYPLLLPWGTQTWFAHEDGDVYRDVRGNPMTLMWYARQRMLCDPTLHACGRLLNEWLVDTFCRVDDLRLQYLHNAEGQKKLRIAEKIDVQEYCETIEAEHGTRAAKPGRIYLPASHTGSKRQMWNLLQNACTLSIRKGKATFFDTMTCNPKWPEITRCLRPGQSALDRPDVVARVFKQKLLDVLRKINTGRWHTRWIPRTDADGVAMTCHETGETQLESVSVVWRVHVIEYQMRGYPHAHIVYRAEGRRGRQPALAEEIDRVVSARFPTKDPTTGNYRPGDDHYAALVEKHMVHHCTPKCRPTRWAEYRCKKGFPYPVCEKTHADPRGFIEYRRSTDEDGYVVPHNREILLELDCHYCRVVASLSRVLRYLYKYLHKGPDTTASAMTDVRSGAKKRRSEPDDDEGVDEIREYQYERSVGAAEAAWRICGNVNHEIWPTVRALHVDDDGRQKMVVQDRMDPAALREKLSATLSHVEIYFRRPIGATFDDLHYVDYFERWAGTMKDDPPSAPKTKKGKAIPDCRQPPCMIYPRERVRVCRVPPIGPGRGEQFFLYVLLKNRSARSFEDLRTVFGQTHSTFREAVRALGLMGDDDEYALCLRQALKEMKPGSDGADPAAELCGPTMRGLFVTLLQEGAEWKALLECAGDALMDDLLAGCDGDRAEAMERLRADIARRIRLNGRDPQRDYRWPLPRSELSELERTLHQLKNRRSLYREQVKTAEKLLTTEQREIYDSVWQSVSSRKPGCYYVDGKAGRGKSTVLRAITARCRCEGWVALNAASTGVAAGDYDDGTTAHGLFRIPIDEGHTTKGSCSVSNNTQRADLLRAAVLITWDELPMAHRFDVEAVDEMLRDIRSSDDCMGGVVFVGGGDFRQTAPVIRGADAAQVAAASVRRSGLWRRFDTRELTTPIRDRLDLEYSAFVDQLGIGVLGEHDAGFFRRVHLPRSIRAFTDRDEALAWANPADSDQSAKRKSPAGPRDRLGDDDDEHVLRTARQDAANYKAALRWADTAVLAPFNSDVDELNDLFSNRLNGEAVTLCSYDREKQSDGTYPLDSARGGGEYADCAGWDGGLDYSNVDPDLLDTAGVPHHRLQLRIGDVAVCMRNLDTAGGLVNGTRLIVTKIHPRERLIECEGLREEESGGRKKFYIPRINFTLEVMGKSVIRRQYPLRHAYAMTLNKSQGKTFKKGLLVLTRDVFSHGQLYVGLTRFGRARDVAVLICPERKVGDRAVAINCVNPTLLLRPPKGGGSNDYSPPAGRKSKQPEGEAKTWRRSRPEKVPDAKEGGKSQDDFILQVALAQSLKDYKASKEERRPALATLDARVRESGHRVVAVPADGNCQFHALARQLRRYGVMKNHIEVRRDCCEQLQRDRQMPVGEAVGHTMGHAVDLAALEGFVGTRDDFDGYLTDMRRGGAWGDHLTLYAAAAAFTAKVKVWSSQGDWLMPKIFAPLDAAIVTDKMLTLGPYHEWHYTSVEPGHGAPQSETPRSGKKEADGDPKTGMKRPRKPTGDTANRRPRRNAEERP